MIVIETGQKSVENLFGWQEILTLIGFTVTIILGIMNIVISNRNNKKARFVNAVTTERIKWIDQLKELLSEFISLTKYYDRKAMLKNEDLQKYFEKLHYLQSKIKFHLNYLDERDEKINNLIDEIITKYIGLYEAKSILDLSKNERFNELINNGKYDFLIQKVLESKNISQETLMRIIQTKDMPEIKNITKLLIKEINKDIKKKYGYRGKQDLINKTNNLVEVSRQYIKDEWEKVKKEAK
ncbi:hypothetical protein [Bacillus norwichensis]|uniref:Uncharacterized protein n=1 Tax=Bacillus norwichensis TaxID=2762217 RepID=A0ABR8VRR4_9BACI|nr:hypothetical protein [Bacillus norwichensis]MBD8007450.1 hypothetical protein [Bacillus norwichensis]